MRYQDKKRKKEEQENTQREEMSWNFIPSHDPILDPELK